MKLNRVETWLMNNPVRALVQRRFEAWRLARLGAPAGGRVLEVGCGRGVGVEILLDRFGAAAVDAFDLDPAQVERARRRLGARHAGRVRLFVADATAIPADDAAYDAVFDFGIVHHVPEWRRALAEVARVLRPGGAFVFEEVLRPFLDLWAVRTFTDHPRDDRFDAPAFREALSAAGLALESEERIGPYFLLGVARRGGAGG